MKKKRVFSLILCACMVLMLLPTIAITASAATGTGAMTLGAGGISAGNEVYFGNYTESGTTYNVPWVVVGSNGSIKTTLGTSPTSLFLLSKYMLGTSAFQSSGSGSYSGSILQGNMDTNPSSLYNTMFTALEKGAVNSTDLSDVSVTGAHLFPLSFDELSDIRAGLGMGNIIGQFWWLRFLDGASSNSASYATDNMVITTSNVTDANGVRPAFNFNLNSVLFASAAEGGKSSGAPSAAALNPVPVATPTEWKLTLLDSSRSSFTIGTTALNGNTLTIRYSGATANAADTAPNEYISAIIEDSSGNIQYYGRIAQPTSSSGTVDIDLSSVTMDEGDKLYVFSEQCNGDKKTDYASELQQVSMTVNAYPVTYTLADLTTNGVSYVSNDNTTDYTATLSADSGYLLPASISVTVGGTAATLAASAADADTAGEYYYDALTGAVKVAKVGDAVAITATGIPKVSTSPAIIIYLSGYRGERHKYIHCTASCRSCLRYAYRRADHNNKRGQHSHGRSEH